MALKNYYDLLGIQQTATSEDVKKAFRKLSVKFHPDKNDGDAFLMEMFKSINEANEILSDPDKRLEYDRKLVDAETVRNRKDMSHAPTHTTYSNEPEEVEEVYTLWSKYLEKKKQSDIAYSNLIRVRSFDRPHYLTRKKVLSSLLALLLVWLFFRPTTDAQTSDAVTANEWVTTESAKVYKKPNIQSKIVGELAVGSKVQALDETNYFIKIDFTNDAGKTSKAYVRKSSVNQN